MLYAKIEGNGKPLLIIHGFLGMSDNWKTLGTHYAATGFEVHMLDLRNHGRSFQSDVFTYEAMAEDVLQYIEKNKLQQASIIGHSMGGKVAMLFAVRYSERVEKLIIADIGPRYYKPHHAEILKGLAAIDFTTVESRQDVEEILKPYIPDLGTRQFLMKSLYWVTPGQLGWRFNVPVFIANQDVIGQALPEGSQYLQPVMFIKGDRSDYIREQDYDSIRHFFPDAVFAVVPNAGHWLHAENPEAFFSETLRFLQTQN